MTVSPGSVLAGSVGDSFTFTYTAAAGGVGNGGLQLTVPSGWSAPQASNASGPGYVATSGCGTLGSIAGSGPWTVPVSGVTLAGAANCTVSYSGVTAPTVALPENYSFSMAEESTSAGALTGLNASPKVDVGPVAPDGSGTMTEPVSALSAGSSGNTLIFTYTAATGGTTSARYS